MYFSPHTLFVDSYNRRKLDLKQQQIPAKT